MVSKNKVALMNNQTYAARTAFSIAVDVWRALLLRESLTRLFASRAAWVWLLTEPLFHAAYLTIIFTVIRVRTIGGIDTVVWVLAGLIGFFFFNRTSQQVGNAINANQSLFTYRQVKPIDTALMRGVLEGALMLIVASVVFAGAALFGHPINPADPLAVIEAFLGLWLFGLAWGLILSVVTELVPEAARVVKLITRPLYLISGVMFPISMVPPPYREWLMFNPIAHGLEAARLGFAAHYHAVPELSISYLYALALGSLFFGLLLQLRFAWKMVAK